MHLFYTPNIIPPWHTLDEDESRHSIKVLRLTTADELRLSDGKGNMYLAKIVEPNVKGCLVHIEQTIAEYGKRPYGITIAIAPTKNTERLEWFLEKATEVGIDRVVPLNCHNSERRTINAERMSRIVVSAVKQSLKAYIPTIEPMTDFKKFVCEPFDGAKLIAHCGNGKRSYIGEHITPGGNTLVLIGPEGDFTPQEVEVALSNGFVPVTLGESRLRTETAALSAVMTAQVVNELKTEGNC